MPTNSSHLKLLVAGVVAFVGFLIYGTVIVPSGTRADDTASSTPVISVEENHFVNARGNTVTLRGVNFSGFEFVPVQGWSPGDPSGSQGGQANGPDYSAIKSWGANVVRIPLNEASWLGYTCTDASGKTENPDPGGNYKSDIETQVQEANAEGLYVILDLHWAAPGDTCPMLQTQMADADHSVAFWGSVASTFKNNPSILFELYNEPFFNFDFTGDEWSAMMQGTNGSFTGYPATSNGGAWKNEQTPWAVASYQQLINVVRATGATNVVLVGTMQYDQDFTGWLSHKPTDPLNQMAAVWHPYPSYGSSFGSSQHNEPTGAPQSYADIQAILNAGIPVVATETGDQNTDGTPHSPFISKLTSWADAHGVGILGWGWDVWGDSDNVLIKDAAGTPTDGYGVTFRNWLLSHAPTTQTSLPTATTTPALPTVPPVTNNPPPKTQADSSQPYIQEFGPASGPPGTVVTFIGHGFTDLKVAWMGSNHSIPVHVLSDTQVQVRVPDDAKTGQIGLLVDEQHASFAATDFVVTEQ